MIRHVSGVRANRSENGVKHERNDNRFARIALTGQLGLVYDVWRVDRTALNKNLLFAGSLGFMVFIWNLKIV